MEPAGGAEADLVAVRRCLSPGCRTCGGPAAVHLIRYPAGGPGRTVESLAFPSGADPAGCTAALAGIEARHPAAMLRYELCATGLGPVRATRAGWLARLAGRGNPGGAVRG